MQTVDTEKLVTTEIESVHTQLSNKPQHFPIQFECSRARAFVQCSGSNVSFRCTYTHLHNTVCAVTEAYLHFIEVLALNWRTCMLRVGVRLSTKSLYAVIDLGRKFAREIRYDFFRRNICALVHTAKMARLRIYRCKVFRDSQDTYVVRKCVRPMLMVMSAPYRSL